LDRNSPFVQPGDRNAQCGQLGELLAQVGAIVLGRRDDEAPSSLHVLMT
jgi:hypothetical protein